MLQFMESHLKNDAYDLRGQEYIDLAWDVFSNGGPQEESWAERTVHFISITFDFKHNE